MISSGVGNEIPHSRGMEGLTLNVDTLETPEQVDTEADLDKAIASYKRGASGTVISQEAKLKVGNRQAWQFTSAPENNPMVAMQRTMIVYRGKDRLTMMGDFVPEDYSSAFFRSLELK